VLGEAGRRNRARIESEFSPARLRDSVLAGISAFALPE
jgi:hypothetical protein